MNPRPHKRYVVAVPFMAWVVTVAVSAAVYLGGGYVLGGSWRVCIAAWISFLGGAYFAFNFLVNSCGNVRRQ